jgi:hypothetical protein
VSSKWPVSMDSGRDVKEVYVTMRTGPTSGQTGRFVCHSWLCPTPEEEAEQGGTSKQSGWKKKLFPILPNANHCFVVLIHSFVGPFFVNNQSLELKKDQNIFLKTEY